MTRAGALFFLKNFWVVRIIIVAHRSMGKPNIPVLIAGKATEFRLLSTVSRSVFWVAFSNFESSSPSPIRGPTA